VREIDHRLAQRGIDLVGSAVGHKGAIELEFREREFLEASKRRIAAAEIVDG